MCIFEPFYVNEDEVPAGEPEPELYSRQEDMDLDTSGVIEDDERGLEIVTILGVTSGEERDYVITLDIDGRVILGTGPGSGGRQSIGIVVFTGVLFATFFTIFVVPVAYAVVARRTQLPGAVEQRLQTYELADIEANLRRRLHEFLERTRDPLLSGDVPHPGRHDDVWDWRQVDGRWRLYDPRAEA